MTGKTDGAEGPLIMQDFAKAFYSSTAWKLTREAYRKSVGGLCESCLSKGQYKAGEIVHHKVHLTPNNINDPSISLNFENLCLLCRDCHGKEHDKVIRRYKVDELGRIIPNDGG